MAKAIGNSFSTELAAAGLLGLPFSWLPDGTLTFGASMTAAQITAVRAVYSAHNPASVPLAQLAWAAMVAGLTITSTGTPSLSGVYAVDTTAQVITSQVTSILLNGTFADGTGNVAWPDTAGALHTFTIAQFKVFATAVAAYVAALFKVINGISVTLPPGSVTIS